MVLNAGILGSLGSQLSIEEEQFDQMFAVNVKSVLFFIKEAKQLMIKSK